MKAKYTYSITCFLWFCKYDSTLLQDGFDHHQPKLSPVQLMKTEEPRISTAKKKNKIRFI